MNADSVSGFHFVFSAPRSGSTWLAHALNAHPEICATENRLFGMFCETWNNRNGNATPRITADKYLQGLAHHSFFRELGFESAKDLGSELLRQWIAFLVDFLARTSGKRVLVDKVTPYLGTSSRVLAQIQTHFPQATIVHLVRDGRDVATSGVFDWLGRLPAEEQTSASRLRDRYFLESEREPPLRRFFDDPSLKTWARYWMEPLEAMNAFAWNAKRVDRKVLTVRYEEMIEDQAAVLVRIFDALDVDSSTEVASACAAKSAFDSIHGRPRGIAEPLSKSRRGVVGDWRNWFTRQDARLYWELAGSWLVKSGYEPDDAWVEQCPEELPAANGASQE